MEDRCEETSSAVTVGRGLWTLKRLRDENKVGLDGSFLHLQTQPLCICTCALIFISFLYIFMNVYKKNGTAYRVCV
jgi:hypothetical protein